MWRSPRVPRPSGSQTLMPARWWRLPPATAVLSRTWLCVPQSGAPEPGPSGPSENYHLEAISPPTSSQICHKGLEREPHAAERLGPQAPRTGGPSLARPRPPPRNRCLQTVLGASIVRSSRIQKFRPTTLPSASRQMPLAFLGETRTLGGRGEHGDTGRCKKLNHTGKKPLLSLFHLL